LERIFRAETGVGFAEWRRQCRLHHALKRLGAGESVSTVSAEVGYQNVSSFIAVFKEAFGETPGRYFGV
jgi:AraC-like DNA-binding protein